MAMKAISGALVLYVLAAVVLWLINVAFSASFPITFGSVAGVWALMLFWALMALHMRNMK
jgi:hypothetical protein